jgi:tetratricopeptide (TPR) repeat protein
MVMLMNKRLAATSGRIASSLLLLLVVAILPVMATEPDSERLQELLYGEALFLLHQQDYLTAITRLQLAADQQQQSSSAIDGRLLLARMKLAYGLHIEAGFDFHALLDDELPDEVRNRAWYELAQAFSHKGYYEAAAEVLGNIKGRLPVDIAGDFQLLYATVLMALEQNLQAARVLEPWQGAPVLVAYADYNRGIALVRAGQHEQALPALQQAVAAPAKTEELLALRDKARLSLGYAFAREEDYNQARKQLEKVRADGPFSNRALLALGWIAHKQGQGEAALVPWTELRGRSPTDPAVLETLLVVPAVHRDLDALQTATRNYEDAVSTYTRELDQVQHARDSVRSGNAVSLLLQDDETATRTRPKDTRYFGPLLASRDFQEMLHGHDELQSMLNNVDRGLQNIEVLSRSVATAGGTSTGSGSSHLTRLLGEKQAGLTANSDHRSTQSFTRGRAGNQGAPGQQQQWAHREGGATDLPGMGIPQLPEIELPVDRTVKSLPEPEFSGLPESGFSGLPPDPVYIMDMSGAEENWLPDSEIVWLPETGRFQMPGDADEDYAYPDDVPKKRSREGRRIAYPASPATASQIASRGFDSGAVPVGEALRELAEAINSATDRMLQLGDTFDTEPGGMTDPGDRVAALQERILRLRARIESAIALYENYARSLALDELDHRQQLLEGLLEQASLELAKTYDQASDR